MMRSAPRHARFRTNPEVKQIVICSPDKDLAQLVRGKRIVCWDRRREIIIDQAAVVAKYGSRARIHARLACASWRYAQMVIPGIKGWGEKSASLVLRKYKHLEAIPDEHAKWRLNAISPGRAASLAESLAWGARMRSCIRSLPPCGPMSP